MPSSSSTGHHQYVHGNYYSSKNTFLSYSITHGRTCVKLKDFSTSNDFRLLEVCEYTLVSERNIITNMQRKPVFDYRLMAVNSYAFVHLSMDIEV